MKSKQEIKQKLAEVDELYPSITDLYHRFELQGMKFGLLTALEIASEADWQNRLNQIGGME